jgi:hypothetical protein
MRLSILLAVFLMCTMISLGINLLWTMYSLILVPLCHLPGPIRSSFFCTDAILPIFTIPTHSLQSYSFICWIPILSSTTFCRREAQATHHDQLSSALQEEFQRLLSLHETTFATPAIVYDVGEAIVAIQDLIILVRNNDIKNKAAIIEMLKAIIVGGERSNENFNAYAARTSSAVTM